MGEKHFKPRPQGKILVFLRGSCENFRRAPPVHFIWEVPRGHFITRNEVHLRVEFFQHIFAKLVHFVGGFADCGKI